MFELIMFIFVVLFSIAWYLMFRWNMRYIDRKIEQEKQRENSQERR